MQVYRKSVAPSMDKYISVYKNGTFGNVLVAFIFSGFYSSYFVYFMVLFGHIVIYDVS